LFEKSDDDENAVGALGAAALVSANAVGALGASRIPRWRSESK